MCNREYRTINKDYQLHSQWRVCFQNRGAPFSSVFLSVGVRGPTNLIYGDGERLMSSVRGMKMGM